MKTNTTVLKYNIALWEKDIVNSIAYQLKRIGHPLKISHLQGIPYVMRELSADLIQLDHQAIPILIMDKPERPQVSLSSFLEKRQIKHWFMVSLLERLEEVGADGMQDEINFCYAEIDMPRELASYETLKSDLIRWENDAVALISQQLEGIGRKVDMKELEQPPFPIGRTVSLISVAKSFKASFGITMKAIYNDRNNDPILEGSFYGTDSRFLHELVTECEVNLWELTALLDQLEKVSCNKATTATSND
ncbi:hypothetical protein [Olivibacter domesticus]|uniref:Uncharacterized protein n=1 Tax=Olivibacter domesticus TaxID=407022 RepID=A0A1H7ID78_OLID1|nr:hypothetical protein [Olivibacter domesticus]SEK60294.1 hypothetical protein SAMN05661044_00659 [Olivibacter domesticus]